MMVKLTVTCDRVRGDGMIAMNGDIWSEWIWEEDSICKIHTLGKIHTH